MASWMSARLRGAAASASLLALPPTVSRSTCKESSFLFSTLKAVTDFRSSSRRCHRMVSTRQSPLRMDSSWRTVSRAVWLAPRSPAPSPITSLPISSKTGAKLSGGALVVCLISVFRAGPSSWSSGRASTGRSSLLRQMDSTARSKALERRKTCRKVSDVGAGRPRGHDASSAAASAILKANLSSSIADDHLFKTSRAAATWRSFSRSRASDSSCFWTTAVVPL
mmetsp:Transcript_33930/g.88390  ORF Transcript_33930/g.88390 Transcript_33930/m.88390 type:complete len:224 (+) Transcript_33930:1642-2313(+)